ncbi:hypothetical protein RHGRI_008467 [Rhododendron griersonianum]|uniref:RING-type E3 ubiquitin transferase n=1 Tax=Rhododendron griersonianum TaxID=479676 RepID=A0AAV6L2S1_9ERIC|nr:hypothetical protein RHGRI_008467 [Rhododendron griersonianum]
MGNSFGCSASGERLVSAARDGDLVEAKMLLDCNPCLAKYSTFGGLNSPLHFAAAKGHNEIVALLIENGADVNSRNYCGQVRDLGIFVFLDGVDASMSLRALGSCTDSPPIQMQPVNGHVRCIRLVVADFVPSAPFDSINDVPEREKTDASNIRSKYDQSALSKFVNRAADGGITALHMAALNGYFDCVQLLLDLHANVSAVTFHYGTSMDLIGAGSTPLHYAACGGNMKCCQILLARGASRMTLNCNGWLPLDVARMWGRHWLEPLLAPNSDSTVPLFPPSNYLSLPLMSVLNIARECGLQSSTTGSDDVEICAVCLERSCTVAAEEFKLIEESSPAMGYIRDLKRSFVTASEESSPSGMGYIWEEEIANFLFNLFLSRSTGTAKVVWFLVLVHHFVEAIFYPECGSAGCRHQLCVRCALYLCSTSNIPSLLQGPPGSIPCPLCRHGIVSFAKLPGSPTKEVKLSLSLSLCTPCMLHSRDSDRSTPDIRKNRVASVSPDIFCPVTCSPFPSVIPMCACSDGPCPTCGPHEVEAREGSPHQSQSTTVDQDKMERVRLEKTSCSSMFWSRRSCSREHQCNSEINA